MSRKQKCIVRFSDIALQGEMQLREVTKYYRLRGVGGEAPAIQTMSLSRIYNLGINIYTADLFVTLIIKKKKKETPRMDGATAIRLSGT